MNHMITLITIFFICSCSNKQPPKEDVNNQIIQQITLLSMNINKLKERINAQDEKIATFMKEQTALTKKEVLPLPEDQNVQPKMTKNQSECLKSISEALPSCSKTKCLSGDKNRETKEIYKDSHGNCVVKTIYDDNREDVCTIKPEDNRTVQILINSIISGEILPSEIQNKIDYMVTTSCH